MSAIDIGSEAIDRATFLTYNYTLIDKTNPANLSGRITSVALYAVVEMSGIKVGIFTEAPANTFTVRDWQSLANCPAGYKEYAVDLNVEAGDFIGIFFTGGQLEVDTASGDGWWLENADYIPCTGQAFAFTASRAASIYGIGTTESPGGASRQGFFIGSSIDTWINEWIGAFVDQDNGRRG